MLKEYIYGHKRVAHTVYIHIGIVQWWALNQISIKLQQKCKPHMWVLRESLKAPWDLCTSGRLWPQQKILGLTSAHPSTQKCPFSLIMPWNLIFQHYLWWGVVPKCEEIKVYSVHSATYQQYSLWENSLNLRFLIHRIQCSYQTLIKCLTGVHAHRLLSMVRHSAKQSGCSPEACWTPAPHTASASLPLARLLPHPIPIPGGLFLNH